MPSGAGVFLVAISYLSAVSGVDLSIPGPNCACDLCCPLPTLLRLQPTSPVSNGIVFALGHFGPLVSFMPCTLRHRRIDVC